MGKRAKFFSGMAVASVICSIPFLGISFFIFAWLLPAPANAVVDHNMMWSLLFLPVVQVLGLVFGYTVKRRTREWHGLSSRRGEFPMADFGVALGWVGLIIYIFFILMFSPAFFVV